METDILAHHQRDLMREATGVSGPRKRKNADFGHIQVQNFENRQSDLERMTTSVGTSILPRDISQEMALMRMDIGDPNLGAADLQARLTRSQVSR